MNKVKMMTFLSVAGLFVGGASPVLAAANSDDTQPSAVSAGTASQNQMRAGECTAEGSQPKKNGNADAVMTRTRTQDKSCDGTGPQSDTDGNQYGAVAGKAETNEQAQGEKMMARDGSCNTDE